MHAFEFILFKRSYTCGHVQYPLSRMHSGGGGECLSMKNSNLYQEKKKEWKVVTLETWHENNKTREKYCLKKPLAKQFVSYTVTFVDLGKGERSEWNESSWVPSDSLQPRGLFSPWTSPGQNTGVGSLYCSSGNLPNPGIEHSSPTLQADCQLSHKGSPRILEQIAYPFSSRPSWPRNQTRVSCIAGGFFMNWATREAPGGKKQATNSNHSVTDYTVCGWLTGHSHRFPKGKGGEKSVLRGRDRSRSISGRMEGRTRRRQGWCVPKGTCS